MLACAIGRDAAAASSDYQCPTMNIQIGHTNSSIDTDYKQKLGTLFGQYVSDATNGAITINVLGDSQLGKENALTVGFQLGMIDMAILSSPTFSNFDNTHLFTELPFVFNSVEAGRASLAAEEYAEMNDAIIAPLGIRFLTTGELGLRYVINNKRPVYNVDNMHSSISGLRRPFIRGFLPKYSSCLTKPPHRRNRRSARHICNVVARLPRPLGQERSNAMPALDGFRKFPFYPYN